IYRKLAADRPGTFLLESVEGGELLGRHSFIGLGHRGEVEIRGATLTERTADGERVHEAADPLAALRRVAAARRVLTLPGLPRLQGGLVGYLGFDLVAQLEGVPLPAGPGAGWPDAHLLDCDRVAILDHLRRRLFLLVQVPLAGDRAASHREGERVLGELAARLAAPLPPEAPWGAEPTPPLDVLLAELGARPHRERAELEGAIERAREAIAAGEVFQVVVSLPITVAGACDAGLLYRALRALNPSPYMFLLRLGAGRALVGASPEVLVRVEGDRLLVRPIAGTRPRGHDEAADLALEGELRADEKELAEHRMLLDLGRNDLGRVAAVGTVRVERALHVERYSHVMHLVSDVRARLAPGLDALDALRAAFPAGTVSGAPKVRALELLATLEHERRGPYAGAVGYLDARGDLDSCIAIRTLLVDEGGPTPGVRLQAGAGVVHDSVPSREVDECLSKARAGLGALWLARRRAQLTATTTTDESTP
ncbi:MAG: anthranilate synthase component I family protein, partial [Myxococcales bacterium]